MSVARDGPVAARQQTRRADQLALPDLAELSFPMAVGFLRYHARRIHGNLFDAQDDHELLSILHGTGIGLGDLYQVNVTALD